MKHEAIINKISEEIKRKVNKNDNTATKYNKISQIIKAHTGSEVEINIYNNTSNETEVCLTFYYDTSFNDGSWKQQSYDSWNMWESKIVTI